MSRGEVVLQAANDDPVIALPAWRRRVAKALAGISIGLLAACGNGDVHGGAAPNQNVFQVQQPTPAPLPRLPQVGDHVNAMVCEGFAQDGQRLVEHPIIDANDAGKVSPRPLKKAEAVYPVGFRLDPAYGEQRNGHPTDVQYYDEKGKKLPEGRAPICAKTDVGIVQIKTDLTTYHGGKDPDTRPAYVRINAFKVGSDKQATFLYPDHLYGMKESDKDIRQHQDIVHNEINLVDSTVFAETTARFHDLTPAPAPGS